MTRQPRGGQGLVVLAAMLLACGEAPDAGKWQGTLDTLADGRVAVENPDEGFAPPDSTWRVEVATRIGSVEGGGPDAFGRIADLAVDGLGRIWVADYQAKEIRVFRADGRHVRTLGGEGDGPGEFRQPIGLAVGPGQRVWVFDPQAGRFTVFDTAGSLVGTVRRRSAGYAWSWRGGFDGRGRYYDLVMVGGEEGFQSRLVRAEPAASGEAGLAPEDTLRIPSRPEPQPSFRLVDEEEESSISASVPFTPGSTWRLAGDGGFWYSPESPYRLYRLSPGHDTLRVVERAWEPVPVTAAERDTAVARLDWFRRQGGEVDPSRIPETKPAIRTFFVDEAGYLWVAPHRRGDALGGRPGIDRFDNFDPEGRYLGPLRLPVPVAPLPEPVLRRDRVYAVHVDELGVQRVVVMRLRRDGAAESTAGE